MLRFARWKIITILSVIGLFALAALPNMLSADQREALPSFLPHQTVNLGLDLRGGSHLLLQMDFSEYLRDHMANIRDGLRTELRKQRIGYSALTVSKDAITVTIRPETVPLDTNIKAIFRTVDPELEGDSQGANTYRVSYSERALKEMQRKLLQQSIEIVSRRVNETGTREPIIQRQGDERIVLQVPGLDDPAALKALLGKTAKMNFHLVNESVVGEDAPAGTHWVESDEGAGRHGQSYRLPLYNEVALSGELLTGANASFSDGRPVVDFQFNALGARKFAEITAANVDKRFAVVLDGRVITAPVIRSSILGGRGIIEGNFTAESANQLAILLRAGALPAPLTVIEERSVGPSLGQDSINAGTNAAIIGTALVVTFMLVFYGLFGVFASFALIANLVIILGVLSLMQATLTLPGIAGIVLTMGMAVDANVLIYERIRDEIRFGKSVIASIEYGFKQAFTTIFDSNITTLLAAFLLFYFGSGTVRGFAVTLAIGILASMFTAVLFTRLIITTWVRVRKPKHIPI
jgi:preprotein translocase subunit SecD